MINKELEEFIKDETKAYEKRLRTKVEKLQEEMNNEPKTEMVQKIIRELGTEILIKCFLGFRQ